MASTTATAIDALPIRKPFIPQYKLFDGIVAVLSIILFFEDMMADYKFLVDFYKKHKNAGGRQYIIYFIVTIVVVGGTSLTMTALSLKWYISGARSSTLKPSKLQWVFISVFHILQLGPVWRCFEAVRYGCKLNNLRTKILKNEIKDEDLELAEEYAHRCDTESNDGNLLLLIESLLENAPQIVLQLYIITQDRTIFDHIKIDTWRVLVLGVILMAWSITGYHMTKRDTDKHKRKFSGIAVALHFLWQITGITSRVIVLALFCDAVDDSNFFFIFLFMGVHWIIMTVWIIKQGASLAEKSIWDYFYDCVVGIMYIFTFFGFQEGKKRAKYIIFYSVMIVEGVAMVILWYVLQKEDKSVKKPWVIIFTFFASFFLSIFIMIAFYMIAHPSMPYTEPKVHLSAGEIDAMLEEHKQLNKTSISKDCNVQIGEIC